MSSSTDRYQAMTQDDYDRALESILSTTSVHTLMSIEGVYECVTREWHNDILREWEQDNPEDDADDDSDAPEIGDLIFDPEYTGIALQPPHDTVVSIQGQDPDDDQVWIVNDGVRIVWEDSAWYLAYDGEG